MFIKKETPTQVFSCKSCENFKGQYFFYRVSLMAASEIMRTEDSSNGKVNQEGLVFRLAPYWQI